MSEPLPPFSGDEPTCPKCQHEGASTEYRALGQCLHDSGGAIGVARNERLHRECLRCGYAWDEALAEPVGGTR
jgi:predicted nucleic-acid-binding Zn-ribbon protein